MKNFYIQKNQRVERKLSLQITYFRPIRKKKQTHTQKSAIEVQKTWVGKPTFQSVYRNNLYFTPFYELRGSSDSSGIYSILRTRRTRVLRPPSTREPSGSNSTEKAKLGAFFHCFIVLSSFNRFLESNTCVVAVYRVVLRDLLILRNALTIFAVI